MKESNEYLTAARTLDVPLFSIILDCAAEENARRRSQREAWRE
jgi:hypothetical protein